MKKTIYPEGTPCKVELNIKNKDGKWETVFANAQVYKNRNKSGRLQYETRFTDAAYQRFNQYFDVSQIDFEVDLDWQQWAVGQGEFDRDDYANFAGLGDTPQGKGQARRFLNEQVEQGILAFNKETDTYSLA